MYIIFYNFHWIMGKTKIITKPHSSFLKVKSLKNF